ncbi:MAG: hypothetical protein GY853_16570 [PVC group bacterium]|nr:hypothetical protein [PVC group bacterium]
MELVSIRDKYIRLGNFIDEFKHYESENTFNQNELRDWVRVIKQMELLCPCDLFDNSYEECLFGLGCEDCDDEYRDECDGECDFCGDSCPRSYFWLGIEQNSRTSWRRKWEHVNQRDIPINKRYTNNGFLRLITCLILAKFIEEELID